MRRQHRHIITRHNHHVPVALSQETRGLLGLYLIDYNVVLLRIGEVVKVGWRLASMQPHEVAARRLRRRRYLHLVYVARLNLCLHEEVHDTIELLANDTEEANFILDYDGLLTDGSKLARRDILTVHPESGNLEERLLLVFNTSGCHIVMPRRTTLERNPTHAHRRVGVTLRNPCPKGRERVYTFVTHP